MRSVFCAAPLLALAAAFCPARLHADPIFSFSFTAVGDSQSPFPDDNVPGATVSGLIYGLPDNGTGPASDIVITSITGATLQPGTNWGNLPIDIDSTTIPLVVRGVSSNSFTVANDVLTSASFLVFNPAQNGDVFSLGTGNAALQFLSGGLLDSALQRLLRVSQRGDQSGLPLAVWKRHLVAAKQ